MQTNPNEDLFASFLEVDDPRIDRHKRYPLPEILLLVLAATICGIRSWRGVEEFGRNRLDWLRKFMPFEAGIPNHQTVARVFSIIKPNSLLQSYVAFFAKLFGCPEGEIIALDGKTLKGSRDDETGLKALHVLNAFAVNAGIALGHLAVDSKTNEITAVPQLLAMLDVRGAIITSDALNTQKTIAEAIIDAKADYVLALKSNHKNLAEEVKLCFDTLKTTPNNYVEETTKGHGRVETRRYWIASIDELSGVDGWKGLKAVGKVEAQVFRKGKESVEIRYFLLSRNDLNAFKNAARGHWAVENNLHWVLDVTFGEDASRVRKDNAPQNFSLIRKFALNLLRRVKTEKKISIPLKMIRASMNEEFLSGVLTQAVV
jgi:predicted transposase YbfD/YdcC